MSAPSSPTCQLASSPKVGAHPLRSSCPAPTHPRGARHPAVPRHAPTPRAPRISRDLLPTPRLRHPCARRRGILPRWLRPSWQIRLLPHPRRATDSNVACLRRSVCSRARARTTGCVRARSPRAAHLRQPAAARKRARETPPPQARRIGDPRATQTPSSARPRGDQLGARQRAGNRPRQPGMSTRHLARMVDNCLPRWVHSKAEKRRSRRMLVTSDGP